MHGIALEKFWVDKSRYDTAERQYYEGLTNLYHLWRHNDYRISAKEKKATNKFNECINEDKPTCNEITSDNERVASLHQNGNRKRKSSKYLPKKPHGDGISLNQHSTLVSEIAKAREHIKNSLEKMDGITTLASSPGGNELLGRVVSVENENKELKKLVQNLNNLYLDAQKRIVSLEQKLNPSAASSAKVPQQASAPAKQDDDDDDVDLFGSDSEEESAEAARIKEERLAAYAAKKSKKPVLIAKSSLVLDIKPWDDETDLKAMEAEVRKITSDGLLWGASKLVPVAFGIKKLSISCVVEDDKVSTDWLTEEIEKNEFVQSVDIAAFNKI